MKNLKKLAAFVATAALATAAVAQTVDNWRNASGDVWKSRYSENDPCWRDRSWTEATAAKDCLPPVAEPAPAPVPVAAPAPAAPAVSDDAKYVTVKSPMIGTFYRTPNPEKPNFVNVGDEIKPGTVLCIIEAMKLFNEIESEVSGRIVKVLVDNSSPVEYDQPLFLIDPS